MKRYSIDNEYFSVVKAEEIEDLGVMLVLEIGCENYSTQFIPGATLVTREDGIIALTGKLRPRLL